MILCIPVALDDTVAHGWGLAAGAAVAQVNRPAPRASATIGR